MIADTLVFAPPGLHGWAINALVCSQVLVGKTSPIAPGAHLAGGAADANDKPLTEGELEARSVAVRGRAFCPRAGHRGRGATVSNLVLRSVQGAGLASHRLSF